MRAILSFGLLGLLTLSVSPTHLLAEPADAVPATIRVALPADAVLTFDGQATRSTSANRLFITPPLDPGKSFHYTLTAKYLRDGRTVTVERSVGVQAGRQTFVSLVPASEEVAGYYAPRSTIWYGSDLRAGTYPPLYGPSGPSRSPNEERGFQPHHWGTPSSDAFYPSDRP